MADSTPIVIVEKDPNQGFIDQERNAFRESYVTAQLNQSEIQKRVARAFAVLDMILDLDTFHRDEAGNPVGIDKFILNHQHQVANTILDKGVAKVPEVTVTQSQSHIYKHSSPNGEPPPPPPERVTLTQEQLLDVTRRAAASITTTREYKTQVKDG